MYDTLGGKVDSLSETDLLDELEKLATVKTGNEVQAVDYPAMFTMENPVQQPAAHSSPTHTHDQPALAMGNIANMTKLFYTRALLDTRYERLESAVSDCTRALAKRGSLHWNKVCP